MSDPVNLENLREMTGGDVALEKELFTVYMDSAWKCLEALRGSLGAGQEEVWRTQAHAFKGMSLNLGAENLGQLCAKAQMNHTAAEGEKKAMLAAIETEYELVKNFLTHI